MMRLLWCRQKKAQEVYIQVYAQRWVGDAERRQWLSAARRDLRFAFALILTLTLALTLTLSLSLR